MCLCAFARHTDSNGTEVVAAKAAIKKLDDMLNRKDTITKCEVDEFRYGWLLPEDRVQDCTALVELTRGRLDVAIGSTTAEAGGGNPSSSSAAGSKTKSSRPSVLTFFG